MTHDVGLVPLPLLERDVSIPELDAVVCNSIDEDGELFLTLRRPVLGTTAHRLPEEREEEVRARDEEAQEGERSED